MNEVFVSWQDMDWSIAVQNLALSEDEDIREESATRIYSDLGPEELGFDQDAWEITFLGYSWDGDETFEDALNIFGGQK